MDSFLNQLKAQSSQLDQAWAQPRLGIVASVDPASFTARVTLQPEGVLSGWLPVASAWVGAGWGLACLPSPGDQVLVVWQEGDSEHGIIVARLWSNVAQAPQAAVGEFWIVHKSGSFLKLRNDGSIQSSAGTWTHTGNLHVTGDVFDQHGPMSGLRAHYNEHVHPPSGTPPSPMD